MQHRGRIQAQGENIASEAWSQNEPPTKSWGLKLLEGLRNKIPKKESHIRRKAFDKSIAIYKTRPA